MADFRKETHGAGSMKGVNLVVIAYDNRVAKKDDVVTTHYLDARIHPDDRRAAGQTTLALVSKKDEKSPSGYNNSARYSASQFEAIQTAAGDNVTDLKNQDGTVVGKIYGIKADVMVSSEGVIANTKTVEASELSVADDEKGRDIRARIFDSQRTAKAAAQAAKAAAPEKAAEAEAAKGEPVLVGAGGVQASADEPELG